MIRAADRDAHQQRVKRGSGWDPCDSYPVGSPRTVSCRIFFRVNVAVMPIRRVRVDKSYDCPICGDIRAVEYENQEFDGEGPDASLLSATRADVVDYGKCRAAANATN